MKHYVSLVNYQGIISSVRVSKDPTLFLKVNQALVLQSVSNNACAKP